MIQASRPFKQENICKKKKFNSNLPLLSFIKGKILFIMHNLKILIE